jgi:hypothetical protein
MKLRNLTLFALLAAPLLAQRSNFDTTVFKTPPAEGHVIPVDGGLPEAFLR